MLIEYDEYLKRWVVWKKYGSIYDCIYGSKKKTDCEKFVEKEKKKNGKRISKTNV